MTTVPVTGSTAIAGSNWVRPVYESLGFCVLDWLSPSVSDESSLTWTGVVQVRPPSSDVVM